MNRIADTIKKNLSKRFEKSFEEKSRVEINQITLQTCTKYGANRLQIETIGECILNTVFSLPPASSHHSPQCNDIKFKRKVFFSQSIKE